MIWQRKAFRALAVAVVAVAAIGAWLVTRGVDRSLSTRSRRTVVKTAGDIKAPVAVEETAPLSLVRVAMLPLADRTTVVAEFSGPLPQAEEVDAGEGQVAIEAGPVKAGVQARDLAPTARYPQIAAVSVRALERPGGDTFVNVTIARRGSSAHRVRVTGSRVYIDFSPAVKSEPEPVLPVPVTPTLAARPPVANPPAGTAPPEPIAIAKVDHEAAYRDLEATTLRIGRTLADRPNVKGLIRLRADLERRDKQLGQQRPGEVDRIVSEVLRLTDQARVAQLARDRQALLREEKKEEKK
jgi:hypothetical protein